MIIIKRYYITNVYKGVCMLKRGDAFKIGQNAPESGVYRIKGCSCCTEEQREIPLVKGHKFPPCKSCKHEVVWEFVRHA